MPQPWLSLLKVLCAENILINSKRLTLVFYHLAVVLPALGFVTLAELESLAVCLAGMKPWKMPLYVHDRKRRRHHYEKNWCWESIGGACGSIGYTVRITILIKIHLYEVWLLIRQNYLHSYFWLFHICSCFNYKLLFCIYMYLFSVCTELITMRGWLTFYKKIYLFERQN